MLVLSTFKVGDNQIRAHWTAEQWNKTKTYFEAQSFAYEWFTPLESNMTRFLDWMSREKSQKKRKFATQMTFKFKSVSCLWRKVCRIKT